MNNSRNIAIGFVIYNPEYNLINRIKITIDSGFNVYIFDNSPHNSIIRSFCKEFNNCVYLTNGKNVGLGIGISAICAQAYYDSFCALLFFDQDTIYNLETLEFIENFYLANANIEKKYSSIVFKSKSKSASDDFLIKDVLLSISSGSLFFLNVLNKLNWHNQSYFVDCVDYEFCFNSYNNNFKVGEYSPTPGFDHVTEQADSAYILFGKKLMMRKYSPNRVKGTISGYLRLIFTSITTFNFKFAVTVLRSMAIYIYFQLLIRIVYLLKIKNA